MEISIRWNICRVCLQEERKSDKDTSDAKMVNIFDEGKKLVQQIYECSGVPMKPSDSLPDKICRKCISVLKYAVHFRKSCRDSNDYLQSIIQRTKSASSMFKPERNAESLIETINDSMDIGYMGEHDNLLSHGKCESASNNEKEKKSTNIKHTYNKRKQNLKLLPKGKKIKLIESVSKDSNKEHKYTLQESDTEYEYHEDAVTINDIDDDIGETDGVMERTEDATDNENNSQEEEDNAFDTEDDGGQEKTFVEESDKEKNSNMQNTYTDFNDIDTHGLVMDGNENDQETEDEETYATALDSVDKTHASHSEIDIKTEETDNTLYYIINKDNPANEDHHNAEEEHAASDDNVDFVPLDDDDEEVQYLEKIENEEDVETLGQVTSTTLATKGEIDLDDTSSTISRNTQEIDAEYVIDEYVIDEGDPHDPLLYSNTTISAKNHKNNMTYSMDSTKRNQSIFGARKKTGTQYTTYVANSNSQQLFVCDLCGNNFTNRQLMNGHMKIHRQEKSHECELCFKRFITACNLQAHMRIHTGEKPFECRFCGRRFTDRSTHLRHERIHTNEKPFACEHCGKAFALATTLHAHLKVHTGERPYRCEPCAKSFKLPHQLKAHQNTHLHKAVEQLCP